MTNLHIKEFLDEGQKSNVIITCFLNEDKNVEIAKIDGVNQALKTAIIERLEKNTPFIVTQNPMETSSLSV